MKKSWYYKKELKPHEMFCNWLRPKPQGMFLHLCLIVRPLDTSQICLQVFSFFMLFEILNFDHMLLGNFTWFFFSESNFTWSNKIVILDTHNWYGINIIITQRLGPFIVIF